jgi:hypothetical protein
MQKLPIDKRGYPVPWFVRWINGEPEFRVMDRRRLTQAINERLCWTCGNPLFSEEVFVIGPMCAINRISSEPPSHRECAHYAATACPFLSKPQMTRREVDLPDKQDPARGVMIARNPGVTLLWFCRHHSLMNVRGRAGAGDGVLFQLGRAMKVEWYARGRPATREEVVESINSGFPLLLKAAEEHDGPEGVQALGEQLSAAMKLIPK